MKKIKLLSALTLAATSIMLSNSASAGVCQDVTFSQFEAAVKIAYDETVGFGFANMGMWATLMNKQGKVCYVSAVKNDAGAESNGGYTATNNAWLGSRVISAQKANTANLFSHDKLTMSTGSAMVAVQPGGSLYGLQHSNPVNAAVAYAGSPKAYGTNADPMMGQMIGGVNLFGGGLALYDAVGKHGSIGVSGDSSCRDHAMAYRLRIALSDAGLTGVKADLANDDNLSLVNTADGVTVMTGLFQQPMCYATGTVPANGTPNWGDSTDYGVKAYIGLPE